MDKRKKRKLISTVAILAVIIGVIVITSGCSGENNQTTDENQNRNVKYNKMLISPLVREYADTNLEVYKLIFDGVEAYKETVDVEKFDLNEKDVERIALAVLDRSEFEYLSGISLSSDKKKINISYIPQYSKEEAMKMKGDFRKQVEMVMTDIVKPTDSDIEAVLHIYNYLSKNTTYNPDGPNVGAYGLLVNKEGICTGYAYSIRYILDQLGIENLLAFSNDESHVWNIVKIKDKFYHIDATWENIRDLNTPTLNQFGQDDENRKNVTGFDGWYTRVNTNQEKSKAPKCDDDFFKVLVDTKSAEVKFDDKKIIYTDSNDKKGTLDISKFY